jgi:preprotein translocase subunit SecE
VARNRKRAKDRRASRPAGAPVAAAARLDRDAAPDPIDHATPDTELAEAQMAMGRPELAGEEQLDNNDEPEAQALDPDFDRGGAGALNGDDRAVAASTGGAAVAVAPKRQRLITRVVTFLQGSWHELQRVQWPDRRQVMQATGVVIGFVIVAAVYLGVADSLAGKLMTFILK